MDLWTKLRADMAQRMVAFPMESEARHSTPCAYNARYARVGHPNLKTPSLKSDARNSRRLGLGPSRKVRGPSRFPGRCQATPPVLQQPAVRCRSVVINDYKSVCCVRSQDFATEQSRKLEESGSPWSATQVYVNIWATAKTPAILNMYWTDIGLWKWMEINKTPR